MPLQRSEYACPTCERETGQHHQILGNMGELVCEFNNNHKWNDTEAFLALRPHMVFKVEQGKPLPQQNHAPYTISVPLKVKEAAETKWGEKAGPTVASVIMQMLEGDTMLIGETDLQRISDGERGLGKRPENSGELCGLIFTLKEEVREAKMVAETAAKEVKAYEGMSLGSAVINLGDQFANAQGKAQDAGLPVKVWLERAVQNALAENWF